VSANGKVRLTRLDKLADAIAERQLAHLGSLELALGYPGYDAAQREVVRVALRSAARDVLEAR
jgi:hypothetical protein